MNFIFIFQPNQSLPPCRGCGRVAAQPPGTHRRTPCGWKVRMGVESWEYSTSTPSLALPLQGGGNVAANRELQL